MVKSKNSKPVMFLIFTLLIIEAFGQCKARFVSGIGSGRVLTCRTGGLIYITDCEEVLKKTYEPNFVFDTTWSIEDIIKTERSFYLNENCKLYKVIPEYDSCIHELISGNQRDRLKSLRKLICFYDQNDSIFIVLRNLLPQIENEITKSFIARYLSQSKNTNAIRVLNKLAKDSCEFIRLEAGKSLSVLGEKIVSYNTLMQIWQMNKYPINVDRFPYFTTSMRNIGTPEAVKFLVTLSMDTNLYCTLDASICLLQLGKIEQGMSGIKYALTTDEPVLFKSAARVINAYFKREIFIQLLSNYKHSDVPEISQFVECILNTYEKKDK